MNKGTNTKPNGPSLKEPSTLLATWFGCGLAPKAPGTWGSLGSIPPALLINHLGGPPALILAILVVTLIGFWAADRYDKASGSHDNKSIVIDEVAGQWIALLPVFTLVGVSWTLTPLAFALFRFFDIVKPWPASFFDKRVKGALGVMADDIVAGLYAALCLMGVIYAGLG